MKSDRSLYLDRNCAGFTMIEMIGVMAILAIMATILVPNALRSLDRAAVVAEQHTLRNLGNQVRKYLYDFGSPPAINTWTTDIGTYSDLSSLDIATNKRQMGRGYFLDPDATAFNQRAIVLSSMRQGMLLPPALNTAQFDALWRSPDNSVPLAASWGGWTAMAADYLVIERINFRNEYRSIQLQNNGNAYIVAPATPPVVRYEVWAVRRPAAPITSGTVNPGFSATLSLPPNLRLLLYAGPTVVGGVDYNYLVSTTDRMMDFNGTHWSPK